MFLYKNNFFGFLKILVERLVDGHDAAVCEHVIFVGVLSVDMTACASIVF